MALMALTKELPSFRTPGSMPFLPKFAPPPSVSAVDLPDCVGGVVAAGEGDGDGAAAPAFRLVRDVANASLHAHV